MALGLFCIAERLPVSQFLRFTQTTTSAAFSSSFKCGHSLPPLVATRRARVPGIEVIKRKVTQCLITNGFNFSGCNPCIHAGCVLGCRPDFVRRKICSDANAMVQSGVEHGYCLAAVSAALRLIPISGFVMAAVAIATESAPARR